MTFHPFLCNVSDVIYAEATMNTEGDVLCHSVLSLSVLQDLVPHSPVEAPEHSVPGAPQPARRVSEVEVSLCGAGELAGSIVCHQAPYFLFTNS